jgi:hypothetical protein
MNTIVITIVYLILVLFPQIYAWYELNKNKFYHDHYFFMIIPIIVSALMYLSIILN